MGQFDSFAIGDIDFNETFNRDEIIKRINQVKRANPRAIIAGFQVANAPADNIMFASIPGTNDKFIGIVDVHLLFSIT